MQHYELADLIIAQHNRSIFTVLPGDEETLAPITVKDYKEIGLSLNALQERILLLVDENTAQEHCIERLERRIETLERNLDAFSGAVCACITGEEGGGNR